MICSSEIRLAPSVAAMNAFIEPCREWIESVMGCARSDSVTLEVEVPFGHLVAEEILKGVSLESSMPGGSGCTSSARTAMGIAAERKPTNRGHLFVRPKFAVIWGEPQEVKIRFSRKQAPYVQERTWHPSQKIEKRPDGSVDHAGWKPLGD
jgi:hypothetical protein